MFLEAVRQLQSSTLQAEAVPFHMRESLWILIPKREGANTIGAIRDLDIPNEDVNVLERMYTRLLHEGVCT